MAQERNIRDEDGGKQNQYQRRRPRWYLVRSNTEVRIRLVRFHGFGGEQQEDPYTGPHDDRVAPNYELREERVYAAWEGAEWAGKQREGHEGAEFVFEAFEERGQGEDVEDHVEEVEVH